MRDNLERILDMFEAIQKIEKYTSKGREKFENEELIQVWVVHHLQVMGEAAAKLDSGFCDTFPEIPWAQIVAMRNILVHVYFGIDLEEVWQVVEKDIPDIKPKLQEIKTQLIKQRT